MSERIKKILMILGFVLVVIIAGFFIWFLFFRTNDVINNVVNNGNNSNNNNNTGNLGTSGNGTNNGKPITVVPDGTDTTGLTPEQIRDIINKNNGQDTGSIVTGGNTNDTGKNTDLPDAESNIANGGKVSTNNVASFPTLGSAVLGNNLITFNKNDGGFYKIDPVTGKSSLITEDKFKGATNIVWSPTSTKAIIEFPDGSNITYDFNTKKQYTLPTSWYDFSFQKEGNKIAFMIDSKNFNERWLSVATPEGSDFKAIEPLGNNADKVIVSYSPNEQMIALSKTGEPVGVFQQQVLFVGLQGENFKYLDIQGRNFHPIWSPKGDKLVYDSYSADNSFNPNLWVVNANADTIGSSHKSLNVSTWVSKCGFDSTGTNLYCGVPRGPLPSGIGLYPKTLDDGDYFDDIYKINIYTGLSTLIAKPVPDISVESLYLSSDNSILYYKDKKSGNIYSMRLK